MSIKLIYNEETLLQKHLEEWTKAFREFSHPEAGAVEYRGALVRASIAAGWLEGSDDPNDVDQMKPRDVRALAAEIDALYTAVVSIDPKS